MSAKTKSWGFGLAANREAKLDPERSGKPSKKPAELPRYHVILLNDNEHTYEYVIQLLRTVFAYPDEKGYQLARAVDQSDRAIVFTTHKELAELKREQIQAFGADQRIASCKGSMSALIEPAG